MEYSVLLIPSGLVDETLTPIKKDGKDSEEMITHDLNVMLNSHRVMSPVAPVNKTVSQ